VTMSFSRQLLNYLVFACLYYAKVFPKTLMATYVCYHIPSDRDDGDHPNAFAINKPAEEVTLRDIKAAFPIPGEYHFRFKVKMEGGAYWMDFTENDACVPTWGPRRILAKVLRLSWQANASKPVGASSKPKSPQISNKNTTASGSIDLFGPSSPPRQPQATSKNAAVTELDLFS
jgi:hypothetical protein